MDEDVLDDLVLLLGGERLGFLVQKLLGCGTVLLSEDART
jgi:hypothetical protein